ncbi:hypothetical protein K474DRAFT_1706118 [Panus rudis PR-1116 ss-1]|nr:hypothetical protein K474DRAFT_1706118 [Panus rudis PR-1116 ss-1]
MFIPRFSSVYDDCPDTVPDCDPSASPKSDNDTPLIHKLGPNDFVGIAFIVIIVIVLLVLWITFTKTLRAKVVGFYKKCTRGVKKSPASEAALEGSSGFVTPAPSFVQMPIPGALVVPVVVPTVSRIGHYSPRPNLPRASSSLQSSETKFLEKF